MCEKIKKHVHDIEQMALENPKKAIQIIHGYYREAFSQEWEKSQS